MLQEFGLGTLASALRASKRAGPAEIRDEIVRAVTALLSQRRASLCHIFLIIKRAGSSLSLYYFKIIQIHPSCSAILLKKKKSGLLCVLIKKKVDKKICGTVQLKKNSVYSDGESNTFNI
jgi:hypothetical protein